MTKRHHVQAILLLAACLVGLWPSGMAVSVELGAWTIAAAGPTTTDRGPFLRSDSYSMLARCAAWAAGHAGSERYILWGNSIIDDPVEAAVYATLFEGGVRIRWVVHPLDAIEGFNVYRSDRQNAEFRRVNGQTLPPESTGCFDDTSVWPGDRFSYQLRAVMAGGGEQLVIGGECEVETAGTLVMGFSAPVPNPVCSTVTMRIDIPYGAVSADLRVYDVTGRLVATVLQGAPSPGRHFLSWRPAGDDGAPLPSGVYFCLLSVDGRTQQRKLTVLR